MPGGLVADEQVRVGRPGPAPVPLGQPGVDQLDGQSVEVHRVPVAGPPDPQGRLGQIEVVECQPGDFRGAQASQRCSQCGHLERGNRVDQATFVCRACGVTLNADSNASYNIARKGETVWTTGRQSRVPAPVQVLRRGRPRDSQSRPTHKPGHSWPGQVDPCAPQPPWSACFLLPA
ncbi:hypothetical protein DN069_06620 [Streptacidiphilus pinicola]|uniref:Cas12f1-like TNB domain-containing protein n=1 Tax=Streptacidiphilus pinicola TaxID=2219663 RepID=A0A2X0IPA9_9ACTN|nr:zinc ribbon domain-containing protein [Streptacidiphilus pinicola]RAG86477.1 hypothetical protein DN069_06620 [Streptacidiphilus pinicola]